MPSDSGAQNHVPKAPGSQVPIASDRLLLGDGVGLPTYPGLYDRFLITVGLVFNALTVWTAWGWETS